MIGKRELTETEWQDWHKTYDQACLSVENRADMMAAAAKEIEQNVVLLGATAIEDELQVCYSRCPIQQPTPYSRKSAS